MPVKASEWLQETPYARDLGVQSLTVTEDTCRLILPFQTANTVGGAIHGGALASLSILCAHAIMRQSSRSGAAAPSLVSLHVAFARPARTQSVWVETRAMRRARELGFFETKLLDHDGKVAAQAFAVASEARGPASAPAPAPPVSGSPNALQAFASTIPFLERRQIQVAAVAPGRVELRVPAIEVNLDRDRTLHEGVAAALIDAAGATCPWSTESPTPGGSGVTVALHVEILARLPAQDLLARATLRARDQQLCWSDVEVLGAQDGLLYAKGAVDYLIGGELGAGPKAGA